MITRILVADDHEMMRAGLCGILARTPGNRVVGEACNGRQAVELARRLSPDVVVLDVTMPLMNGIEALRQIVRDVPAAKVIMLSINCDRDLVSEALSGGASAYVLKCGATVELDLALRAARENSIYLSPKVGQVVVQSLLAERASAGAADAEMEPPSLVLDRRATRTFRTGSAFAVLTAKQREVLQLLAEGMTNKEVAANLSISTKTAEAHRAQLMEKLRIHTVAGLTKYAIRHGLTSVET